MLLSISLVFIISSLVSFVGSLQLGPVNLFVINTVLYSNKRAAMWVALGGSLPEFLYCGLAVYASVFLQQLAVFQLVFKFVFIAVLISIGLVFLFKKTNTVNVDKTIIYTKKKAIKYFLKGLSLASLNPQLLPFWLVVYVYFNSINFLKIKSELYNFSFILGAGCGAFMLLSFLIILVAKYKVSIIRYSNNKYYFKVLSIVFFIIAIQQLLTLVK